MPCATPLYFAIIITADAPCYVKHILIFLTRVILRIIIFTTPPLLFARYAAIAFYDDDAAMRADVAFFDYFQP